MEDIVIFHQSFMKAIYWPYFPLLEEGKTGLELGAWRIEVIK
jgi:hypothetical protein